MNPERLFRAIEIKSDQYYLENHLVPDDFNCDNIPNKSLPLFKKYGIKVSSIFSEIYSRYNGIKSDLYITPGLYYYYINPFLMNLNLYMAYDDKNVYSMLFPQVKQPKIVLKNMNGHMYKPQLFMTVGEEISIEESIGRIRDYDRLIIKPALASGNGEGVRLLDVEGSSDEELRTLLNNYNSNFIIQQVVKNHPEMSKLNTSSLNTCRLITYRRVDSDEYVLLAAMVRFGQEGSIKDNVATGGGICKVCSDGLVDDAIRSYKNFKSKSLKESKGIDRLYIPHYDKMVECALNLHRSLPYFDLIGWDLTVDDEDEIVLVEYNYAPTIVGIQICNGPLFGKYTEELLGKLTTPITENVNALRRSFVGGKKNSDYIFDLDRTFGL